MGECFRYQRIPASLDAFKASLVLFCGHPIEVPALFEII